MSSSRFSRSHSEPAAANVADQQALLPPQADQNDRAERERQTGRERGAGNAHRRRAPQAEHEAVQQRNVHDVHERADVQRRPRVARRAQRATHDEVGRERDVEDRQPTDVRCREFDGVCVQPEDRRDVARKEHTRNRQHQTEHAAERQRRDGDAAGFDFVVASPRARDQRRRAGADRHHHGLQREEHALPCADRGERFGAELTDDFRLHETDDAVQQVAENRRQRELQDARDARARLPRLRSLPPWLARSAQGLLLTLPP